MDRWAYKRITHQPPPVNAGHPTSAEVDAYEIDLAYQSTRGNDLEGKRRLALYAQRWPAVQRAVAYQGTMHRDAFYGSRAYWHSASARGLNWALEHHGDLSQSFFHEGRGNVYIAGDVKADLEITGDAIVHILGDLDATLEVKGVCEVIIAGRMTEHATLVCDGQLELYVGGDALGVFGATGSSTTIIDGNLAGSYQCGAPATLLTITGDLSGTIAAPKDKDAVLTLRVDGYAPTAKMLDLSDAGFTRANATLGRSDAPAGLYPQNENATRPTARWVVLRQRMNGQ